QEQQHEVIYNPSSPPKSSANTVLVNFSPIIHFNSNLTNGLSTLPDISTGNGQLAIMAATTETSTLGASASQLEEFCRPITAQEQEVCQQDSTRTLQYYA